MQILQQAFRVYVELAELESCIRFYEKIQATGCERRVRITETGIEAAKVGGVLILAGDSNYLDRVKGKSLASSCMPRNPTRVCWI